VKSVTKIALKPFGRSDFSRLIGWVKSPEFLLQWAGPIFNYPLDNAQMEKYINGSEKDFVKRKIFKVIWTDTNEVVGHIELNDIDKKNKSAALCRVLIGEPSLRGKGIGTQMVTRLLTVGFDQLGLHRIDLVVFDFNRAAINCYKKAGFTIEGHLRDARRLGDQYWSLYQMSILAHEWNLLMGRK
jgi:RimJ/RimL family protein N-acetyltransferase